MIAFLDKIADRLLKKFPETMEGVLVVLPSKRAVVFLKHYLSKKIKPEINTRKDIKVFFPIKI